MEQGCGTYVPLPEVVAPTTAPTTTAPTTTTTTSAPAVVGQVIEVDTSVPPAVELAWTGRDSENLAVGGSLALMVGCFLIWMQRRVAR
ncbi:hypothetical protein B7486_78585 [cyanobacterium TDX16]|nr:hypothetical protein B7486_78585 [cyanobacterium TDX16]